MQIQMENISKMFKIDDQPLAQFCRPLEIFVHVY